MMDPCTHRVPVAHLSHLTGAPVLSVRYRLAPQNPFPAALVDALTAYLSLIHPPPGALHKPVPANKIILAGDSAGGNLSLVLLQTLMTLKRASRPVRFHGKEVDVELPAGVATTSPWCDVSRSMPSIVRNAKYDYLESPVGSVEHPDDVPFAPLPFPPDSLWPMSPPRVDMYANANMVLHPLVSPMAASPDLWKDAPPVFISTGEEGLTDEDLILARRMHQAGVPVITEQFEGQPHCHGLLFISTPTGKRFFKGMADFCRDAVAGRVTPTGSLTWVGFQVQSIREIPLEKACPISDEEIEARMRRNLEARIDAENELRKAWNERARL
jgi:acetyl esterase/lipase